MSEKTSDFDRTHDALGRPVLPIRDATDLRRTAANEAFALHACSVHDGLLTALEKISEALADRISAHKCSCTHPCDDYFVFPSPCGARNAESYRNIRVIADRAIALSKAGEAR